MSAGIGVGAAITYLENGTAKNIDDTIKMGLKTLLALFVTVQNA